MKEEESNLDLLKQENWQNPGVKIFNSFKYLEGKQLYLETTRLEKLL